ncbi:BA75_01116T0 [Komagataella pastoris]|uniref:Thymocyte nuclear protein 1 n=1 Tax=Komagataella pastoris TaxID=4922 RepID=A0A1B2J6J0_PICPA|nr:BA75_01116T0 [Komagataella pastoris]
MSSARRVSKNKRNKGSSSGHTRDEKYSSGKDTRYWLIKSEPHSRIDSRTGEDLKFSLADLSLVDSEPWDGVRNHEAKRNMLDMAPGDICLFYHSNCPTPGIVGLAEVVCSAHPDESQFDRTSPYFDSKSTRSNPHWWCVDVKFKRRFRAKVTLRSLKTDKNLQDMALVRRSRLSITPVTSSQYSYIIELEKSLPDTDDIDCQPRTDCFKNS